MKILCVRPFADFSVSTVADGLTAGLRENGHEVVDFVLTRRLQMIGAGLATMCPAGQSPAPEMIAEYASEGLCHRVVLAGARWVLVVCGAYLHPDALSVLRRIGVGIAIVFTESPYQTDADQELRLASVCDLAFTNERTCVPHFQAVLDRAGNGGSAHYLPHAHDPAVHTPEGDPSGLEERSDVLLIGTGFVERQRLLEQINWDGIDLKLGGLWPGISHYGSPHRLASCLAWPCIPNRDTARLYRGAKIVLNPHRWHPTAESANPRVYEAAAVGAFQISDHRAEIPELFGDSIPTYPAGVPWRLEALVRRYLADDAARTRLVGEARRRVAGHTFTNRAAAIVAAIEQHGRARGQEVAA